MCAAATRTMHHVILPLSFVTIPVWQHNLNWPSNQFQEQKVQSGRKRRNARGKKEIAVVVTCARSPCRFAFTEVMALFFFCSRLVVKQCLLPFWEMKGENRSVSTKKATEKGVFFIRTSKRKSKQATKTRTKEKMEAARGE